MSTTETNELRSLLADVVTRLFTERVTPELLAASEQGQWATSLWQAVEENGLTLPLVPEAKGGAGGTWQDAYVVVRAAGRHGAPIPLPETIVGAWLCSEAGLDVPAGALTLAPVQGETLAVARVAGAWRLSGTAARVPWGASAGHVVAVAEDHGRPVVVLVARGEANVAADKNVALEPRDTLTWDRATVVAAAPAPAALGPGLRAWGAMIRAAQMAGALEAVLPQSVRYATERQQFGRPIGAFQAIQHNLAIVAAHTAAAGLAASTAFRAAERAAAGTERAAGATDRGGPGFEIAAAKVRVGEAAGVAAALAHQVHGAIGFTYEHSLHFLTRRLWSWRAEFGGEAEWAAVLGREAAARGPDALWPYLTSR
jgi:acyl-CoA dehydrogenase